MRRLAIAAVAVIALASTWTATAAQDNSTPQSTHRPPPARCTAEAFRPFSAEVWRLIRWKRGAPEKSTIKAQRRRLKCAPPGHRKKMQKRWRKDKHHYNVRRKRRLRETRERREIEAVATYDCGSAGRFAIPCHVVECESRYNWGAVNPASGAFTAYQFLPSTYANACRRCDGSKLDYHETAKVVWDRSGGEEWVCA